MIKLDRYNYVRTIITFIFILSFAFSTAINNISFVFLILISLIHRKKRSVSKINFKSLFFIIPLLAIFYFFMDILLAGNIENDYNIILVYFILFGSPILFWGDEQYVSQFKRIFVITFGLILLFTYFGIIKHYFHYGEFNFYKVGGNVKNFMFFERLYFGLFSIIATIFIIDIFKNRERTKYLLIFIVFVTNFIISSRLSFGIILILILVQLIFDLKQKKSFKYIIIGVLLFTGVVIVGIKNVGFKKRAFLDSKSYTEFITNVKINEPRYAIWKSALILNDNTSFNKLVGFDSENELLENLMVSYDENIFIKSKRKWFIQERHNTHNQFIFIYLLHGSVGLGLFIAIFVSLFLYVKKNNLTSFYLLFSTVLFLNIENGFERQYGVYLLSICIGMLVSNKNK